MVGARMLPRTLRLLAVVVCTALLLMLFLAPARSQGLGEADFTIEENLTVEITPTGDAHITDVLQYDPDYFEGYASVFEEYPNLLSRRYRDDTDVGEIENFDVKVNKKKATVTITFDSPGYAYNMGGTWDIYGFGYEPSEKKDTEMIFEGEGNLNNEFTLFEEIPFTVTTTVKFPEGATGPKYNAGDTSVSYVLPYKAAKSGSFLQNNKSVWIPVCIVLMALSLLLLLYVIVNSRRSAAPAIVSSVAVAPPLAPSAPAPPSASTYTAAPPPPAAPVKMRFCKHCGGALKEQDKSFCSSCGKPLE